mgnify:CR=1 FL=1
MPGILIAIPAALIVKQPDLGTTLIVCIVSASFLGLLATQFLGAANDNILRWLVIGIGKDFAGVDINMLLGLGLMKTDRYAKNGIGSIDDKKMCDSVDLVNSYMGLPKKVECKDVYSKDFYTLVQMPKN